VIHTRFSRIAPVIGLLALCVQLSAETMFVILKDQAQQAAPSSPLQDTFASRLQTLGASDIKHYTVLNMLRVTNCRDSACRCSSAIPISRRSWMPPDNAGIIDRIDQQLAGSPAAGATPASPCITGRRARGLDRPYRHRARSRDFRRWRFCQSEYDPAGVRWAACKSAASSVTQNRHLVPRALPKTQEQQCGAAAPQFLADSLSTQAGADFGSLRSARGLRFYASLTWDQHFTSGLNPYRRQLVCSFMTRVAPRPPHLQPAPSPSDVAGDLVLKVKPRG
jgi:hypothetical protein